MTGRSSCPECSTILRIRDQSFVGRRVNCPECNTVLKVESADRDGNFGLRRLTSDELDAARKKKNAAARNPVDDALSTKKNSVRQLLNSRVTVACLLLLGVISLVTVVSFKSRSRPVSNRSVNPPADVASSSSDVKEPIAETTSPSDVPPSPTASVISDATPIELTLVEEIEPVSAMEPDNFDQPYPGNAESSVVADAAPVPMKIDVEGKLSLKIVSYKQPKVARKDLIEALEEQLGAPIRYDRDELGGEGLDEKISFELQNTTIGGVIERVAQTAGWQVRIEETGLRLLRTTPPAQP